jgi:hypothetical protein
MDNEKTPYVVTIDVVFQTTATDENQAWKIAENLAAMVGERIKCDGVKAGDVYPNPQT